MEPEIIIFKEKKMIGKRSRFTLADDRTYELWKSFMPERKNIDNILGSSLYSIQVFKDQFDFSDFSPQAEFEKWAAVEVPDFDRIPDGMESFIIPAGLYAVFIHRGAQLRARETFTYIFGTWLPASGYVIDNRPHFEILGEKYKNNDPESEEEIWIPVRSETKDD